MESCDWGRKLGGDRGSLMTTHRSGVFSFRSGTLKRRTWKVDGSVASLRRLSSWMVVTIGQNGIRELG